MQEQNGQRDELEELEDETGNEAAHEPAPAVPAPSAPPKTTAPVNPRVPVASQAPVKPNIRLRQNMTFEHHLFESDVQDCLKNTSYKKWQPELRSIPHKHFFHTKDMRGKSLTKSSHACGHYHHMTWTMDANGNLVAKSQEALRDASFKYEDGSRAIRPEECTWRDKKGKVTTDAHTHVWTYLGTDILSPGILKNNREQSQEEAAGYGVNVNTNIKPMGQARPLTEADGITVREK